jgi:hypothetical protein
MRRRLPVSPVVLALGLSIVLGLGGTPSASAAPVTFSGTVSYDGAYSGDTLYVAVLDTTVGDDAQVLAIEAYAVGSPPFAQPYSLDFDNDGVAPTLVVASFLDVDGGGVEDISGADVLGWFAGSADPLPISSSASQNGLDFDLPRAEIRGTVTFAPGQVEAQLEISRTGLCDQSGFNPPARLTSGGVYAIVGIYPGTYCLHGEGFGGSGDLWICYGDPSCVSPTPITLSATEVRTGIDLDFNDVVPVEGTSWGRIKGRFGP